MDCYSHRMAGRWTIAVSVVQLVSAFGLFTLSNSRTFQFFGGLTDRGRHTRQVG